MFDLKFYLLRLGVVAVIVLMYLTHVKDVRETAYAEGVEATTSAYNAAAEASKAKVEEENKVINKEDTADKIVEIKEKIITEIKIVEVINYVDRKVEVPVGCNVLADDFIRVRREATNIINSARGSDNR